MKELIKVGMGTKHVALWLVPRRRPRSGHSFLPPKLFLSSKLLFSYVFPYQSSCGLLENQRGWARRHPRLCYFGCRLTRQLHGLAPRAQLSAWGNCVKRAGRTPGPSPVPLWAVGSQKGTKLVEYQMRLFRRLTLVMYPDTMQDPNTELLEQVRD